MKKIFGLLIVAVAVLSLNGCGGGQQNDGFTTLFLVDEKGYSYGGIDYACYDGDVLMYEGTTPSNGEFSFYPGEDCVFDFFGLNGNWDNLPPPAGEDEIIRIVDIYDGPGDGKNGIPYECEGGDFGETFDDGRFYYDVNDICLFRF